MILESHSTRARFAQCLWLMLLFALTAAGAAGQCLSPNFPSPLSTDAGYNVAHIAAGDFNKDGRTDAVVANANSDFVSILTCTQAGVLTSKKFVVGSPQTRVAVADFNDDTKPDLLTLHAATVALRLGNGLGSFGPASTTAIGSTSGGRVPLVVADFNNDGKLDVFVGNESTGSCPLLLGNGLGGLKAPSIVALPGHTSATAGDFNGDGNVDLAIKGDGGAFFYVVLGDGTGHFGNPVHFNVGWSSYITTADLNLDNKLDIITVGQSGVTVVLGNGMGQFGAAKTFGVGFIPMTIAVGDMNGDGLPDLVPAGGQNLGFLQGKGTGVFAPAVKYLTLRTPVGVALGDFNGDGKQDVWAATVGANGGMPWIGGGTPPPDSVSLFLGDGSGKLLYPSILKSGPSPYGIVGADLNNDGKLDLAVLNIGHNSISIHKGDGAGGFGPPVNLATGSAPRALAVSDLNNDGKLDLVTANYSGSVSVILATATGFGARMGVHVPGFSPTNLAVGDFNRDGKADLAVVYASSSGLSILLGDGTGRFGAATGYATPYNGQSVAVADFNGDGKSDLAVGYAGGVVTLLGDGDGGFIIDNTFDTGSTISSLGVADFNGDGKTDLAALSGIGFTVFLGNGLGDFTPKPFIQMGGSNALAVGDYNGDGRPDLATSSGGPVFLLTGKGAGDFAAPVTYMGAGSDSHSLAAGDFNSDGRPDLAVAYRGDTSQTFPLLIPSVAVLPNMSTAPPAAAPSLSVADVQVTEGDSGTLNATFTIKLSSASAKPVAVSFYTADGDALKGVEYQGASGRVVFAPGATSKTVVVPVAGDVLDEADETFLFLLADPINAGIGKGRALGKILDNDPTPTLSINDVTLTEGNSGTVNAVFTVTLSKPSGRNVTVKYATANGTAVAPSDYTAKLPTVLTFLPGQTTKTVSVQVLRELVKETNETFFVNLSEATGATITDAQGVGTISNDD